MKNYVIFTFLVIMLINSWANASQVKTEQTNFTVLIDGKNYRLEAMFYIPLNDKIKHSLIIMTHGRNGIFPKHNEYEAYDYRVLNQALAERGYLVMMLIRRGYGNSQGPDCEMLNTPEASATAAAKDIKAAVEFMKNSPDVIKAQIIAMGQSCGGWAVLALSTMKVEGLKGVVNISGAEVFGNVFDSITSSSGYKEKMNKSAGIFGKSCLIPSLWIYAENDRYSHVESLNRWFDSFRKAGGKGQLVIKPKNGNEGHYIFKEPERFIDDIINFTKEIGFNN